MAQGVHERHPTQQILSWKPPYIAEVQEQRSQYWQCICDQREDKKHGKWKTGLVSGPVKGKENEMRFVRVNKSTGYLDRPIQLLYPLELHCNDYKIDLKDQDKEINELSATAIRPWRTAARITKVWKVINIVEKKLELQGTKWMKTWS